MGKTAWVEVRLALTGTLRLARGDRGGLSCFDRSLDGFWRSFRAAVAYYPLYLVLLTMRITVAEWESSSGWRIASQSKLIGYVIGWVAFPLVMLTVTQRLGRAHRFFDFMVPYNWCQLPQSALFVLVGLGFQERNAGSSVRRGHRHHRRGRDPGLRKLVRHGTSRPRSAHYDRPRRRFHRLVGLRPRGGDQPSNADPLLRLRPFPLFAGKTG